MTPEGFKGIKIQKYLNDTPKNIKSTGLAQELQREVLFFKCDTRYKVTQFCLKIAANFLSVLGI